MRFSSDMQKGVVAAVGTGWGGAGCRPPVLEFGLTLVLYDLAVFIFPIVCRLSTTRPTWYWQSEAEAARTRLMKGMGPGSLLGLVPRSFPATARMSI